MEQNVDIIDADDPGNKADQKQEKSMADSEVESPALSKRKLKRDKIIETITRLIDFF